MSKFDQIPQKKPENLLNGEKLQSLLQSYNIPLETWGTGGAKTIDDLLSELHSGEAKILEVNGELVRETKGLAIDVYCSVDGKIFRLKEERQVFTDGRIRERRGDVMETSMGEKLTEDESQTDALRRAIREELGVQTGMDLAYAAGGVVTKERDSGSFPGLKSKHQLYRYDVLLPESEYKQEGYVEVRPTKSTYFVWEEVNEISSLLKSRAR